MRYRVLICLFSVALSCSSQTSVTGPQDSRAQKTFQEAKQLYNRHQYSFAMDGARKADKQDGGHCTECEQLAYDAALSIGESKIAQEEAIALLANAAGPKSKIKAYFMQGVALYRDGQAHNREKSFQEADRQLKAALEIEPKYEDALYLDGITLANLKQDEAAQAQFREYLKVSNPRGITHQRAQRYLERPELARARMAPAFRVETLDGKFFSLDDLTGKVVLIDFWATWCGPCREALPHVQEIAKHFSGPNFVVLSVSLDSDEAKWKDFVAKNGMTWPQYRDKSFAGPLSSLFGVHAIPHTFVIDADGVLQDEKIGDAAIEGKLKKLIAQAQQLQQVNAHEISTITAQ